MTNDIVQLFICLSAILVSSLRKCLFKSCAHNLLGCHLIKLYAFFIYSGNKSSVMYMYFEIFLPFSPLPLQFLNGVFWRADGFSFDEIQLISVLFYGLYFCDHLKNLHLPRVAKIFFMWFRNIDLSFTVASVIHFEWILCIGWIKSWSLFCSIWIASSSSTTLKKTVLSHWMAFVRNQMTIYVWVYFWTLYSVLLICISILLPTPYGLDYIAWK